MHDLLVSFYEYGFVIIKNVPTENNYIVKFANSIGSVRRTNFGEHFNVKSKPNPNDLAYTSLKLAPHTDNPYRCLLYTSPSPRDLSTSRMPSSA